jgi:hypothetical protein
MNLDNAFKVGPEIMRPPPAGPPMRQNPLLDVVEAPFRWLHMHTPARRFVGVAGLAALYIWTTKPQGLFFRGLPRPSALVSDRPDATYIDWVTASLICGGLAAVLI